MVIILPDCNCKVDCEEKQLFEFDDGELFAGAVDAANGMMVGLKIGAVVGSTMVLVGAEEEDDVVVLLDVGAKEETEEGDTVVALTGTDTG